MLLSYGWRWKKEEPCNKLDIHLFCERRHNFRNPCQLSLSLDPKKKGKKGVGER